MTARPGGAKVLQGGALHHAYQPSSIFAKRPGGQFQLGRAAHFRAAEVCGSDLRLAVRALRRRRKPKKASRREERRRSVTGDLSTGDKVNALSRRQRVQRRGRTDRRRQVGATGSARQHQPAAGPSSAIKLDRFVYAGPSQPGAIAVNLVKGALRFATGDADKKAYVIETPTAALGVRGTILKISRTRPRRSSFSARAGRSFACARRSRSTASAHRSGPGS